MLEQVMNFLNSGAGITVGALVVEMSMRLIKTDKPMSILHAAGAILKQVSKVSQAVADFLDKILPQRLG